MLLEFVMRRKRVDEWKINEQYKKIKNQLWFHEGNG